MSDGGTAPVATTWHAHAASTIGSVHVRDHRPCQDAAATWAGPGGAVVAVADGHGHHDHFRSDVGARLAADCAVAVARSRLDSPPPGAPDPAGLAREMVEAWRARVADHLHRHPWPSGSAPSAHGGDVLRPYGTTLIVAAVLGATTVVLQIGDGDAVVVDTRGRARRAVPDDPALDGVRTPSLCQPDPLGSLRSATFATDEVALVYACTDGFGTARVEPDWWRVTGTELAGYVATHGTAWVADRLPGWLAEPARVGGDDTTLALLARG